MKNAGAMVYWIDRRHMIQTRFIAAYELKGGASYDSEADHITNGAEHKVVILSDRAGNALEQQLLENLRQKAAKLRGAR